VVTIGRQPDNLLCIDNPIVSGHHARIYWENNGYFLEDLESFNGTYMNNRRVAKAALNDGDVILIGKHMVEFQGAVVAMDAGQAASMVDRSPGWQAEMEKSKPPQLQATMVLDTKKARERFAQMGVGAGGAATGVAPAPEIRRREIGAITIVAGKTDQQHYVLTSKLSVIGKSEMASIRLKRWFAPRIAASIHQREDGYFLVAAAKNIKIRINDAEFTSGQRELKSGDQFSVAGITARFGYEKG
jgi:pSer/pThr/pTyr-binding forkhead associated (FHA) protein